jgi:hypothetical protein
MFDIMPYKYDSSAIASIKRPGMLSSHGDPLEEVFEFTDRKTFRGTE